MPYISSVRTLFIIFAVCLGILLGSTPAHAGSVDPYVTRFLEAPDAVSLELDGQGRTQQFSPEELSDGKRLFEENCKNCHVGGATLPDPDISLALSVLEGAAPPRDNIENLVAYLRQPMAYDGSEETFWCREVPESWMSQSEAEDLSAFILRAAQKAPGWGTTSPGGLL